MKCNVKRNRKTGRILQVNARNDRPSDLFAALEKRYGDSEIAVKKYANSYLPRFIEKLNPNNDVLLATLMLDGSLKKQDYDTVLKLRNFDKVFSEAKMWTLYKERLNIVKEGAVLITENRPFTSQPLADATNNQLGYSISEAYSKSDAEAVMAYELGYISESDIADYYSDFHAAQAIEPFIPSIEDMEKYVQKKYQDKVGEFLTNLLANNTPIDEASEILRLLSKPNVQYNRAGIELFLKGKSQELFKNNPILESINSVDTLQEKSTDLIENGLDIDKSVSHFTVFGTKEVNQKLDDNFDPKLSTFDSTSMSIESDDEVRVNEKSVGELTTTVDVQEAKANLDNILGPNPETKASFETVLDNMKDSGETWSNIYRNAIYLNDESARQGIEYDNAFRYVFKHLLSNSEASQFIDDAKRELAYTKEQLLEKVQKLRKMDSSLMSASIEVLVDMIYEQHLAEKYMNFALKGKTVDGDLQNSFQKIFNFISQLPDRQQTTKALFHKINTRGNKSERKGSENNFPMSKIAFKQISTGFKEVTKDGEPVMINGEQQYAMSYATASESTKVINDTAAIIHSQMEKLTSITESAMDEMFNKYFDEQVFYYAMPIDNPANRALLKNGQTTVAKLRAYHELFNSEDNRQIIKDEVMKLFKILEFNPLEKELEDSLNQAATIQQINKKSAYELGGYQMSDRELRQFISFTTYEGVDPITGQMKTMAVNGDTVFMAMTRAMASRELGTGEDFMKELKEFSRDQVQTKAVFEKIAKITRYGTPSFDGEHSIINLFKKNLDMERIHFLTALFDPETQNHSIWSANSKDVAKSQIEQWNKNWNDFGLARKINNVASKQQLKEEFHSWKHLFNEVALDHFDKLDEHRDDNIGEYTGKPGILDVLINGGEFTYVTDYSTTDDDGNHPTRTVNIKGFKEITGIELSRGFLRFNILKALEKNFIHEEEANPNTVYSGTPMERMFDLLAQVSDNNPDIGFYRKYSNKNIPHIEQVAGENVSFLDMLNDTMFAVRERKFYDSKNREILTEDKHNPFLDHTEGLISSLTKLANANSVFDETLAETSFQDAQGNTRNSFIQKSYQSVFVRRLQNKMFRDKLKNDPEYAKFMQSNRLLKFAEGTAEAVFDERFLFYYYGDIRQTGNINGKRNNSTEERAGATPKNIDMKSWIVNQMLLFTERVETQGIDSEGNKFTFYRSYFSPKVFETKTTNQALLLPLGSIKDGKGVYSYLKDGDYSNAAYLDIYDMFKGELDLTKQVHDDMFTSNGISSYLGWLRDGAALNENAKALKEKIHINTDDNGEIVYKDRNGNIDLSQAFGRGNNLWNFQTVLKLTGGPIAEYFKNMKALREELIKRHIPELQSQYDQAKVNDLNQKISNFNLSDNKEILKKGIKEFLDREFKGLLKKLENYGIIATNDNGEISSSYISDDQLKDYGTIDNFLKDWFINHYVNVQNFNNLVDKAPFIRKNAVDAVKRNGGSVAYGPSLGGGQFKAAFFKEPMRKNKFGVNTEIADGQSYMSINRLKFMIGRLGRGTINVNQILDKVRLGEEISWEETKKLETVNGAINPKKGVYFNGTEYFKLSYLPLSYSLTSKVRPGMEERRQELANDIKDFEETLKEEVDPEEIAYWKDRIAKAWVEYEDLWEAKTGREILHKMRRQMQLKGIDELHPESSSKLSTKIPAAPVDGEFNFDYSTTTLDNENWRLQVETPSGKGKITYFSQVLQLIDNEQLNLDAKVNIQGVETNVGNVIKMYRKTLAKRVRNSVEAALNEIATIDEKGNFVHKNAREMQKKMRETLESSGADDSLLEFFRNTTADGTDFEYDPNLPSTRNKFEQLFLAHFSKGVLQQKVPGRKVTLASGFGLNVTVDENDNVVSQMQLEKFRDKYYENGNTLKSAYTTRRLKWSEHQTKMNNATVEFIEAFGEDEIAATKKIRSLINRFNLNWGLREATQNFTEEQKEFLFNEMNLRDVEADQRADVVAEWLNKSTYETQQGLAEVMMPAWRAELLGFTAGDVITKENKDAWDSIMTMFGSRIPSQDKHSMIAFKIVDFLPVEYGDVAVFPDEIVELSGADFDIDSLFSIQKDYFQIFDDAKKQKVLRVYGEFNEEEVEAAYKKRVGEDKYKEGDGVARHAWLEYKNYASSRNEKVKRNLKDLKNLESYQKAFDELREQMAPLMTKRDEIKATSLKIAQDKLSAVREDMGLLPISRADASAMKADYNIQLKEIKEAIALDPQFKLVGDAFALNKFVKNHKRKAELDKAKEDNHALYEQGLADYYAENERISNDFLEAKAAYKNALESSDMTVESEVINVENLKTVLDNVLKEQEENNEVTYGEIRKKHERFVAQITGIYSEMTADWKAKNPNRKVNITAKSVKKNKDILQAFAESDLKKNKDAVLNNIKAKNQEIEETNSSNEHYADFKAAQKEVQDARALLKPIFDDMQPIRARQKLLMEEMLETAMRQAKVPSTFEEYIAKVKKNSPNPDALRKKDYNALNNSALSNLLVDLNIALYTNSGVAKITETPASMTKLQGGTMSDGRNVFGLSKILSELLGVSVDNYEYNTLTGQIKAKESNMVGLALVGPSANANVIKAALARTNTTIDVKTIMFDNLRFQTFSNYKSNDIQFEVVRNNDGEIASINIVEGKATMKADDLPVLKANTIDMKADNIKKIEAGNKTTTLRTKNYATKLGILPGHAAITTFGDKKVIVVNRGYMDVEKAGGANEMLKSEGYDTVDQIKFDHARNFINGEGSLMVYDILDYESNKDTFQLDFDRALTLSDERIMDELSTILSAMTDNAKHNDAAKLNFSLNNIGTFLYMTSLGMGLNRVGLTASQPILRHLNKLQSSQGAAIQTQSESAYFKESMTERLIGGGRNSGIKGHYSELLEKVNQAITEKMNEEGFDKKQDQLPPVSFAGTSYQNAIELIKSEDIKKQGVVNGDNHLNSRMLLDSLEFDKYLSKTFGKGISDISFAELIDSGKFNLEQLAKLMAVLRTQHNVLRAFSRLDQQRKYFSSVKHFLNLNTGLEPTFGDQLELKEAFKLFHVKEDQLLAYNKNTDELFDREGLKEDDKLLFSIENLLMNNDDVYETAHSFAKIMDLSKEYVLSQTPFFTESIERLFNHTIPSIRDEARVKNKAVNNLIGFITNQAYKNYLKKKEGRKVELFNPELMYSGEDSLLSRMEKIIEKHELYDNAFMKLLIRNKRKISNKDLNSYNTQNSMQYGDQFLIEVDEVGTNTRTVQTPEFVNSVVSGYRELMVNTDIDVKQWAEDAFNYLIVKDGLLFSNNSYLKYIAPEKFSDLSDVYKKLLKAFKDDQWKSTKSVTGLEEILGMTKQELEGTYFNLFARDYSNKDVLRPIESAKFTEGGDGTPLMNLSRIGMSNALSFEYADESHYNHTPSKIHINLSKGKFNRWEEVFLNRPEEERKNENDDYYIGEYGLYTYDEALQYVDGASSSFGSELQYKRYWDNIEKNYKDKLKSSNENAKKDAANIISAGSNRAIVMPTSDKFVGLNFPLYLTMTEEDRYWDDEIGDWVLRSGATNVSLYMLTHTESGSLMKNPDPNLLVKQSATYTKIPFINTHMYSYLDKPSEYQAAMLNNVHNTIQKLTEEGVDKNYRKIDSLKQLRTYLANEDFSISLFKQFKGSDGKTAKIEDFNRETAEASIFNDAEYESASAEKSFTAEEISNIANGDRKVVLRKKPIEELSNAGRASFVQIGDNVYTVENLGDVHMSEVANTLDYKTNVAEFMKAAINFNEDSETDSNWINGEESMIAYVVRPAQSLVKPATANVRPNFGISKAFIGPTADRIELGTFISRLGMSMSRPVSINKSLSMYAGEVLNASDVVVIVNNLDYEGKPDLSTKSILNRAGIDPSSLNLDEKYTIKGEDKKIIVINPSALSDTSFDFAPLQSILEGDDISNLGVLGYTDSQYNTVEFFKKLLNNPNADFSMNAKALKDSPTASEAIKLLRKAGFNFTVNDLLKKRYFNVNPAILKKTPEGVAAYNYIMGYADANKTALRYQQIQKELRLAAESRAEKSWKKAANVDESILSNHKVSVSNIKSQWLPAARRYGIEPSEDNKADITKVDALYIVGDFESNSNPQARPKVQSTSMRSLVKKAYFAQKPVYFFNQKSGGRWFTFDASGNRFVLYREENQKGDLVPATPPLMEKPFLANDNAVNDKGSKAMLDLFNVEATKKRAGFMGKAGKFAGTMTKEELNKASALAEVRDQKSLDGSNPDCE